MTPTEPRDGFLTVWEERVADIGRFAAAGGSVLWDVTNGELSNYAAPIYFDRDPAHQVQNPLTGSRSVANVLATKAIAEETGVSIILGTGHYFEAYFDQAWWERTTTTQIADFLIADLVDEIPGTGVRAGFLGEIASDLPVITPNEEKSFRATGRAAAETGVLVSTHAPTFPTGLGQVELLTSEGVHPERIVIGHTDTVKDIRYHRELLGKGVYIQYDCMMACKIGGQIIPHELDRRVGYLKQLVDEGHHRKILLSQDVSQRSHQAALGGPGLTFVLEEFHERAVAAGIGEDVLREMVVDNPRRAMFGE
ncbi:phosphotriesterase [Streptomyces shenzhenensis]|uniref:phosphotriesterase family protein n=1 Tax=Streptomyces shenzhenensis TaxID=943815 RepID=UPI00368CE626